MGFLAIIILLLTNPSSAWAGAAWTIGTTATGWTHVAPTSGPQSGLASLCKTAAVSLSTAYGFQHNAPSDWAASHSYSSNTIIVPTVNNAGGYAFYETVSSCTSISSPEPSWNQTPKGTPTSDNNCSWINFGRLSSINGKYTNTTNWAAQMNIRLQTWGFNAVGTENQDYPGVYPSGGVPALGYDQISLHALRNNSGDGYAGDVKDVYSTVGTNSAAEICGSVGGTANTLDYWDSGACSSGACENAKLYYQNCITNTSCTAVSTAPIGTLYGYQPDENDDLYGFNKDTTFHQDMGYFLITESPMFVDNSGVGRGISAAHTYTDHTFYAKLRARDELLDEYECTGNGTTHSGTGASCCTASGVGTCSADPAGGPSSFSETYIGATPASDGLTQLNTAWGLTGSTACTGSASVMCNSAYTTWNTTDTNGLGGISAGTYASYGTGTGFLDENGKRTGPPNASCSALSNGTVWSNAVGTSVPQIETDSHSLVQDQAKRYIDVIENAFNQMATRPPFTVPLYHPPAYVLTAMSSELKTDNDSDVYFWFSPLMGDNNEHFSSSTMNTNMTAMINGIHAGGNDIPISVAEFTSANDSTGTDSQNPLQSCAGSTEHFCDHSQRQRALDIISFWEQALGFRYPSGKYAVIGLEHEYMWDQTPPGGGGAFGLSSASDNGYDGAASSAVSNATAQTACAVSHTYTAPAMCNDGTNLEGFYGSGGSGTLCVTSGSLPTWGNAITLWGTDSGNSAKCNWIKEDSASYTRIPDIATFGGASPGGGGIAAFSNFLTGATQWTDSNGTSRTGICDPVTTGRKSQGFF